jgi:cold shock protein
MKRRVFLSALAAYMFFSASAARSQEGSRKIGTVRFYSKEKGYGFLKPDDSDLDVFFHRTEVTKAGIKAVEIGQRLSYVIDSKSGRSDARDLRLEKQ